MAERARFTGVEPVRDEGVILARRPGVDRRRIAPLYFDVMEPSPPPSPTETALIQLEERVDRLLSLCARLSEENRSLRARQETLVSERADLIEKTEQARSRVEAMINRLKAMENNP
jgi:cell division protein ZapB